MHGVIDLRPSVILNKRRNNFGTPIPQIKVDNWMNDWWLFNTNDGSGPAVIPDPGDAFDVADDYSSVGYDLTLTYRGNPTLLATGSGPFAATNSIGFSGASQYVERADQSQLRVPATGDLTFAVWAYLNAPASTEQVVFAKRDNTHTEYEVFYFPLYRSYGVRFRTASSGWDYVSGNNRITAGRWYLLVLQYDRTNNRLSLSFNNNPPIWVNAFLGGGTQGAAFRIAGNATSAPNYFNGRLAHLMRWQRLLNAGELNALFSTDPQFLSGPTAQFHAAGGDPPPNYPAASALPAAPSDCAAEVEGDNTVTVSWVNNAVNAIAIEIWRSTDGAAYERVGKVRAWEADDYLDSTADTSAHAYAYKVRAMNYAGFSDYSNEAATAAAEPQAFADPEGGTFVDPEGGGTFMDPNPDS